MSIFKQTLSNIRDAKNARDRGEFNAIPFGIEALDRHLPGVMKGLQYIVTASSGVGKTQLTKDLFVNRPYKFVKDNPNLGIKLKILYFALEESKEEFMLTLISNRLKNQYGISVGVMELRSIGSHHLPDHVLERIEECGEYFKELEESIEIIDSISHPYGIYNYVRSYATEHGTHYYRDHVFKTEKDGIVTEEVGKVYDRYEANDPNEFVVVITDHMSLLLPENNENTNTLHKAMSFFSSEYCRKNISKHWKYCVVNIQQQAADKEKQQYTTSGQSIESKLEPSLDGLGDNKLTQRDALVVLGLFAPERYQIEKHLGYDITKLRDNYRCLTILKNRIGTPNMKLPLLFNGKTNSFRQLPDPGSTEMSKIYDLLIEERKKK
jgi:replicative DNA helicase